MRSTVNRKPSSSTGKTALPGSRQPPHAVRFHTLSLDNKVTLNGTVRAVVQSAGIIQKVINFEGIRR